MFTAPISTIVIFVQTKPSDIYPTSHETGFGTRPIFMCGDTSPQALAKISRRSLIHVVEFVYLQRRDSLDWTPLCPKAEFDILMFVGKKTYDTLDFANIFFVLRAELGVSVVIYTQACLPLGIWPNGQHPVDLSGIFFSR